MNTITLSFTIEQLNVVLRHLDAGQHGNVRQLIDYIVSEAQRQQQAQPEAKPLPEAKPPKEMVQ